MRPRRAAILALVFGAACAGVLAVLTKPASGPERGADLDAVLTRRVSDSEWELSLDRVRLAATGTSALVWGAHWHDRERWVLLRFTPGGSMEVLSSGTGEADPIGLALSPDGRQLLMSYFGPLTRRALRWLDLSGNTPRHVQDLDGESWSFTSTSRPWDPASRRWLGRPKDSGEGESSLLLHEEGRAAARVRLPSGVSEFAPRRDGAPFVLTAWIPGQWPSVCVLVSDRRLYSCSGKDAALVAQVPLGHDRYWLWHQSGIEDVLFVFSQDSVTRVDTAEGTLETKGLGDLAAALAPPGRLWTVRALERDLAAVMVWPLDPERRQSDRANGAARGRTRVYLLRFSDLRVEELATIPASAVLPPSITGMPVDGDATGTWVMWQDRDAEKTVLTFRRPRL